MENLSVHVTKMRSYFDTKYVLSRSPFPELFKSENNEKRRENAATGIIQTALPFTAGIFIFMVAALISYYIQLRKNVTNLTRKVSVQHSYIEELQAFSYSVSHDLRYPFHHIRNSLFKLSRNPSVDEVARQQIEQAKNSLQHADDIVNGMLALLYAVEEPLLLNEVDTCGLVKSLIDEMSKDSKVKSIHFEVGALPSIQADRTLLKQVFINLLSNAVKFSKSDGSQGRIHIKAVSQNDLFVFSVTDNGVGFDATKATQLFQPFYRLHHRNQYEGTGLGLVIVRRIIEKHGGKVWAASYPDETSFYFALPA